MESIQYGSRTVKILYNITLYYNYFWKNWSLILIHLEFIISYKNICFAGSFIIIYHHLKLIGKWIADILTSDDLILVDPMCQICQNCERKCSIFFCFTFTSIYQVVHQVLMVFVHTLYMNYTICNIQIARGHDNLTESIIKKCKPSIHAGRNIA